MRSRSGLWLAAAALVVGGCGSGSDGPPATLAPGTAVPTIEPTTPEVSVSEPTTPGEGTSSAPAASAGPAGAAARDLAEHLGVPPEEVSVVRVVEVTWRDGSVGCPQPGMAYPQVLTDGTLVELSAGGRTYEYHSGGRRDLFRCQRPEPPLQVHG